MNFQTKRDPDELRRGPVNDSDRDNWPPQGQTALPNLELSDGCEVLDIVFEKNSSDISNSKFRFGPRGEQSAVVKQRQETTSLAPRVPQSDQLQVIRFVTEDSSSSAELIGQVQSWFEVTAVRWNPVNSILLTLQGCQLVWQPGRVAIFAPRDKIERVTQAIVEGTFYEHELRQIETSIDATWDQTDQDSPLACEFNERSIPRRTELATRFQAVLRWRIRYARLAPQILVPHVHPPTLASQIGERLRERMRMAERLELLDEKLTALERVYELISHRSSEFMLARTGHILEWIIIVLLLGQTILLVVDFLSTLST